MRNVNYLLMLFFLAMCPVLAAAEPETATLNPVADGFIREQDGTGIFHVQYAEIKNAVNYSREGYFDFDLHEVLIDTKSAKLELFVSKFSSGTEISLDVYGAYGNYCGDGLTWESRVPDDQMEFQSSIDINKTEHTGVYVAWDVSEFIKKAVEAGENKVAFIVRAQSSTSMVQLATVESDNKPMLTLSTGESDIPVEPELSIQAASLFTDNMVLQRDEEVKVWGTGLPSSLVELFFDGTKEGETTCNADGNWEIQMTARPADNATAHVLTIKSGEEQVEFQNVVLGDVWLAAGQSNMAFQVKSVLDEQLTDAMADCDYPNLRYYDVAKVVNGGALVEGKDKPWTASAPTSIETWSAIAFFFAREIHQTQNVPIGIIGCSNGGATADAFISEEAYAADPKLDAAKCPEESGLYQYYKSPSSLFNRMVKKLTGYGIKGVIWYQGESNASYANNYEIIFKGLINDWRNQWNKPALPFLFVQLPAYTPSGDNGATWAEIREAQLNTWQTTENTGMAVTMELGEYDNIHPASKAPAAHRLALYARAEVYGETGFDYKSPTYQSMEIKNGNEAWLSFNNLTSPLTAQKEISEFELCGEDFIYYPAVAEIVGEQVKLTSESVTAPVAARYAWANATTISLFSEAGLPLSPFRTMKPQKASMEGEIPFEEIKNVYASKSYPGREPIYAINGAGLTESGGHEATANGKAWQSNGVGFPMFFKIELNQPQQIDAMHIWNFNWSEKYLGRGVKEVDIYTSESDDDLSEIEYDDTRWTKVSTIEVNMADGTNEYMGERFELEEIATPVKWFGLNILSRHVEESGNYAGISEIKLFKKKIATSVEALSTGSSKAYGIAGGMVVNAESAPVHIYSIDGICHFSGQVDGEKNIPLKSGIYIVKIGNESTFKTIVL